MIVCFSLYSVITGNKWQLVLNALVWLISYYYLWYFSICICVLRVCFFLYSAILICTEWTFHAGSCVGL